MNKNFFNIEEKENEKIKKVKDKCEKCKLYINCTNPKMKYTGKGEKEILIIGEAPGEEEDRKNIQFIGRSGKLLRDAFEELKFNFEKDCWKTNAIICHPQKNKTPTVAQISCCRNNLLNTIKELKPKKIITFGKIALQSLIGNKISVTSINKWVGWKIPDQDFECFIFPNFHPAYLLRNQKDEVLFKRFFLYLKNALLLDEKFKKEEINIKIIFDDYEVIKFLQNLNKKNEIIAIDFETTGLKPYKKGHEIICISITDFSLYTYSFLYNEYIKKYLFSILENENIGKIGHNISFENRWANYFLVKIKNWIFDTKISTHILDNRSDITGLKFQTYVNFGICDYDNAVKKYIESEKGANSFNKMKELDKNTILKYCGYDTYFTMKLYLLQNKFIDNHLKKGLDLFIEGALTLSELSGVRFDKKKYKNNIEDLDKEIGQINLEIANSKELKKWNKDKAFNENSSKQMRELLYDICQWKTENFTKKGFKSVDSYTLSSFNRRFTNNIIKKRKLLKIRDTYLLQFFREIVQIDDSYYIYPFFDLCIPKTYRSSSYYPNFQNIPKRDELAKKYCRSLIVPSKDNQLLEIDFKGMEVATSCCYHHDSKMIDYVKNPENDMHRDVCIELFLKEIDNYTKYERFCAKNGFVFPAFYGSTSRIYRDEDIKSGFGEITKNLWEMISIETKNHLHNKGIKNIYDFQNHVEETEEYFWNVRFTEYKQWKFDNWKFYKQNGYVELKTGFRCNDLMSFNDVNNYPIQGTAFHILLYSLIKLKKYLDLNNYKSRIIGQIHDSIIIDVFPIEVNQILQRMKIIIEEIINEWKWIIVPLTIEAEITDINESWNMKKSVNF